MSLPAFLIAGGRRCGTSSLYHWMRAHPDVHLPAQQDTMFFVDARLRSRSEVPGIEPEAWETEHTPAAYASRFPDVAAGAVAGEKCADILFWEPAQERLARYVPGVRLIVTLRDPVRRAWSHYWNEVGKGRESLSFGDALSREEERSETSVWARFHLSYAARGRYDESLARLLGRFPRESVHVLVMERTSADPVAALRGVYGFLGVDPSPATAVNGARHNVSWTTTRRRWVNAMGLGGCEVAYGRFARRVASKLSRGHADRATRERRLTNRLSAPFRRQVPDAPPPEVETALRARFAPHVDRLCALLDDPLPEWPR